MSRNTGNKKFLKRDLWKGTKVPGNMSVGQLFAFYAMPATKAILQ